MTMRPLLFAAVPALALAACAGTPNRGLESVHQPVVSRADLSIDLAASGAGLARGEAARLAGWFDAIRLGYGDRVAVDDGGIGGTAAAQVAGIVAGHGLMVADRVPPLSAPVATGTVRVVVGRSSAAVRGCPDWSRNLTNDFTGHTHSNYGCASNANLAAMIADPADLIQGRAGATPADPAATYKAIDAWRTAKPTGAAGALKTEGVGGSK